MEKPYKNSWTLSPAVWSLGVGRNKRVGILFRGDKFKKFKILEMLHIERGMCLFVKVEGGGWW